jgi:hypothetical protein
MQAFFLATGLHVMYYQRMPPYVNKTLCLALLLLVSSLAPAVETEKACVDRDWGNAIPAADASLFEQTFGDNQSPMREQWDATAGLRYFAFTSRGRTPGTRLLNEAIWQLSTDGMTLRYLICEKELGTGGIRRNFRERIQKAVAPYVFMNSDAESQRIYLTHWLVEPQSRQLLNVHQRSFSFDSLKENFEISELQPEHEQLITEFAATRPEEQRAQWDATQRTLFISKVTGTRGEHGFKRRATLGQLSEDGMSLLLISKELEHAEGNKFRLDYVLKQQAVYPGVFATIDATDTLVIYHFPTKGTRVRVMRYDLATQEGKEYSIDN